MASFTDDQSTIQKIKSIYNLGSKNKELGRGAFGVVYLSHVANNPKSKVAVKIINTIGIDRAQCLEELNILNSLKELSKDGDRNDSNVVKMIDFLVTRTELFIVLQFINGGNYGTFLFEHAQIPDQDIRFFFKQIACGMSKLFQAKVVHRDLKPENLLLWKPPIKGTNELSKDYRTYILKIADFGLGKIVNKDDRQIELMNTSTRSQGRYGTPHYMSPEMIRGEYSASCDDPWCADLWSIGIILYESINLFKSAFMETVSISAIDEIIKTWTPKLDLQFDEQTDKDLVKLAKKLIVVDRKERMKINEFVSAPELFKVHRYEKEAKLPDIAALSIGQEGFSKRAGMSDYNREQIKTAKEREDERRKKKAQTGTENLQKGAQKK